MRIDNPRRGYSFGYLYPWVYLEEFPGVWVVAHIVDGRVQAIFVGMDAQHRMLAERDAMKKAQALNGIVHDPAMNALHDLEA